MKYILEILQRENQFKLPINKKHILIVIGVQTNSNPAFFSILNSIKDNYNVSVIGKEDCDLKSQNINYKTYSKCETILTKLKIYFVFRLISLLIPSEKRSDFYQLACLKFRLFVNSLEFKLKTHRNIDFIINIDTLASIISTRKKGKVPNALFIYELYADQDLKTKGSYHQYLTHLERQSILNSNFMISSCNSVLGDYLNEKYSFNNDILVYSVCPEKKFTSELHVSTPVKFYYHGVLFENRGIENAIMAFKNITGGKLYIRGKGPIKSKLDQLIIDNNLKEKVFFLDYVPMKELPEAGVEFDLGISLVRMNVLNHKYNVGFKTFENISSGLALILPESVPLKELISKSKNGITYKDATCDELTSVFTYCINNIEQIKKWKEASKKVYEQEYNPLNQQKKLVNKIELSIQ